MFWGQKFCSSNFQFSRHFRSFPATFKKFSIFCTPLVDSGYCNPKFLQVPEIFWGSKILFLWSVGVTSYEAGFVYSNEGAKRLIEETLGFGLLRTLSLFQWRTIVKMSEQDGCGTQTAHVLFIVLWLVRSHRVKRRERAGGVAMSAL